MNIINLKVPKSGQASFELLTFIDSNMDIFLKKQINFRIVLSSDNSFKLRVSDDEPIVTDLNEIHDLILTILNEVKQENIKKVNTYEDLNIEKRLRDLAFKNVKSNAGLSDNIKLQIDEEDDDALYGNLPEDFMKRMENEQKKRSKGSHLSYQPTNKKVNIVEKPTAVYSKGVKSNPNENQMKSCNPLLVNNPSKYDIYDSDKTDPILLKHLRNNIGIDE
jgi:hypothetical protein